MLLTKASIAYHSYASCRPYAQLPLARSQWQCQLALFQTCALDQPCNSYRCNIHHRFVKLGVRLLDEQRKGSHSKYIEWLTQLPRRVESPVNWSAELVQQLQYPHLIHKVTEQQQEWSALYDKFISEGLVNKASAPSKQVSSSWNS